MINCVSCKHFHLQSISEPCKTCLKRPDYKLWESANPKIKVKKSEMLQAIKDVLDFHYGRNGYNFSHMPDLERAQITLYAWEEIKTELEEIVKRAEEK